MVIAGHVRGVRLHVYATSSLTPVPFSERCWPAWNRDEGNRHEEMNMFRRLLVVSAIAAGALALIRLNARRASQRATDEAARANWKSEGGASAASRGTPAPNV